MYYLGVPTTRAGTLVTSDTYVDRDIKYNGQVTREKATIISRIAPTFIRFGSFQIANPPDRNTGQEGPSYGNGQIIEKLLNYVIQYHYPHIFNQYSSFETRVLVFAEELTSKTAKMVALWQSYGFTHGVLNTDNMSIVGLTIDYGPFGFLDNYNPDFISNASDSEGRYRFINQPGICKWNLQRLFQSIGFRLPHIQTKLNRIVERFCHLYHRLYLNQMRRKLGFFKSFPEDEYLIQLLLDTMQQTSGDFTNIFRSLSQFQLLVDIEKQPLLDNILKQTQGKPLSDYAPNTVPSPQPARSLWTLWLRLYKDRLGKELIGIDNINEFMSARINLMNHSNPRYILRNYLAQRAIQKAEQGDYSEVKKLLDVLRDPFDDLGRPSEGYDKRPPQESSQLTLTCSS